jgi:3-oxoacyl-[acyl-carrier protein] reductase
VAGDITSQSYIDHLVSEAAAFGHGKIHIIVNNAGYTYDGVIHKMTDAQWDAIINIHNTAPFKLIRACAPYFRVKDGEPRNIVNISSTSGMNGNAGQANYGTAKAGVTGLTKVICKEWGPQFGVRANTVGFGRIDTRLTRSRNEGEFVVTPDGTKVPLGIPQAARSGDDGLKEIPLRRAGSPMEAAAAILMIASPLSSYVSGQTIMVTGGRNA